jgi:hypothetical protein
MSGILECCDAIRSTVAISINNDKAGLTKLDAGNGVGKTAPPGANLFGLRRGRLLPPSYEGFLLPPAGEPVQGDPGRENRNSGAGKLDSGGEIARFTILVTGRIARKVRCAS